MKRCTRCSSELPLTEFNRDKSRPDGLFPWCKPCHRAHSKAWRSSHPAEARELGRARSARKRAHRAELGLSRAAAFDLARYGITLDEYETVLLAQEGLCAICGTEPVEERLNVDHCHQSGRFRGLLCRPCNWGLGNFRDDPSLLLRAADYLASVVA